MAAEIGVLDLIAGVAIVLGVFAAFMVWATFPLLCFALLGASYGALRYGLPALGRAASRVEGWSINVLRLALYPVALWTLRGAVPVGVPRGERRRRS